MEEVQRLRAYVAEHPEDLDAVRALANLNYDISNWQRAAELYQQYLAGRPGDVDVITDLGACLRHMGQAEKALELFRQVRQARPDHWQSLYNEILVLAFDLGRLDEAAASVDALRQMQPGNPEVERLAGEVERRRASGA